MEPTLLVLILLSRNFAAGAQCPSGTTPNSASTKCFDFVSAPQSWLHAKDSCVSLGGHLASVQNAFDNAVLVQGAADSFHGDTADFWIGGNDLDNPGIWAWEDGAAMNYTNWASGYPAAENGCDCVGVQSKGTKWWNVNCLTVKPFVCEVPTAPSPTCPPLVAVCPSTWMYFADTASCYKVFFNGSWDDAELNCESLGAHLVSIHGEDESLFVQSIAQANYAFDGNAEHYTWIGLHSKESPRNFVWSDASLVDFTAWGPNAPVADANNLCVVAYLDHHNQTTGYSDENWLRRWLNRDCKRSMRNHVCKMKIGTVIP